MNPVTRDKILYHIEDPHRNLRISLYAIGLIFGVWAGLNWCSQQAIISASIGGVFLLAGIIWSVKRYFDLRNDLSIAVENRDVGLVRTLINSGVKPNLKDEDGNPIEHEILLFAQNGIWPNLAPKKTRDSLFHSLD